MLDIFLKMQSLLKALKKTNLTAVIVALIIVLPVIYYIHQLDSYKSKALAEKENVKKLNQEAYDNAIYTAQYEFIKKNRDQCWVYNQDAIDCDLTYLESYKVDETPQNKFKKAVVAAQDKYPAAERLYLGASPDFKSLLEKPIGNLSEREAVRKILALNDFKDFVKNSKGTLRYTVDKPTDQSAFWIVQIYEDLPTGEKITLHNYYKVDAFSGEVSIVNQ